MGHFLLWGTTFTFCKGVTLDSVPSHMLSTCAPTLTNNRREEGHVCVCTLSCSLLLFSLLSHVRLFVIPWTSTHQASPSFSISWSLFKLISIDSVMPSNHLIFCRRLLLPPSIFPSIRVFSNESALCIRRPNSLIPWFLSQDRPLAPPKNSTGDLGVQMQQKCGVGRRGHPGRGQCWRKDS